MESQNFDVIVVGAGHNGLVAATLLARGGLKVLVLEEKDAPGGATRTEYPFPKAPKLGISTGAYLLGLMPPELLKILHARIPLIRRDPHYFLPTTDKRYLLFSSDRRAMKDQFLQHFSEQDWRANERLNAEIASIREDLAPAWLEEPMSVEDTADRYIRANLRQVFINLVTQPVEDYLARFGFKSELLLAMYAVTDGFSGLSAGFGSKRTGMNFLVHNMCRLPDSDATWMIVQGGMGTIAAEFARLAQSEGTELRVSSRVERILIQGNQVQGVVLANGQEIRSKHVLCNCDPFRMRKLVGNEYFPKEFNTKLDGLWKRGTTLKVNMALSRLPSFKCLPENRGQHNATIHLLPQITDVIGHIDRAFKKVSRGELADFPTIEWYIHTQADPSLQDEEGRHNAAFFVQWVPYDIAGSSWEREEERYVKRLIEIADDFAPGFKESVVDTFTLTPPKIEKHFGMTGGHIHHVDNTFGFDQRVPYATPIPGLYSCSAGTHPAGSVIGAAGHNAAQRLLQDLGFE